MLNIKTMLSMALIVLSWPVFSEAQEPVDVRGSDYYQKALEAMNTDKRVAALNHLFAFRAMNPDYLERHPDLANEINTQIENLESWITQKILLADHYNIGVTAHLSTESSGGELSSLTGVNPSLHQTVSGTTAAEVSPEILDKQIEIRQLEIELLEKQQNLINLQESRQ